MTEQEIKQEVIDILKDNVDKEIYCDTCKKNIQRQFRFTDWDCDSNDDYGDWEYCLTGYKEAVKENPTGRYSVYAVTICDDCDSCLEDEGVLFNENCPDYKNYGLNDEEN